MSKLSESMKPPIVNALLGGILVFLGVVFLVGQFFNIQIGEAIWPFFVIGPGVSLFLVALTLNDETGRGFAMVGSLVTMVGLVLLFQNLTEQWASWSYAWALVAPTSVGLGQWLYGSLKNQRQLVESGRHMTRIGLTIFLVGAIFFELIIGVSGFGLGRSLWPILLIGFGLFLLLRNLGLTWRSS